MLNTASRRRFLSLLAKSGVLAFSAPARALTDPIESQSGAIVDCFSDIGGASAIGRAYLRLRPSEAEAAVLLGRLEGSPRRAADWRPRSVKAFFHRQIRADYQAGRIVTVDGWILSQTEARLCGVVALRPSLGWRLVVR